MSRRVDVQAERCRAGADRGFTLIELLVVIVVIGLLISAISIAGVKILRSQKVKGTEGIMKNVTMAIEQFSEENPLGAIYDRRDGPGRDGDWNNTWDNVYHTFGSMPPYQLEDADRSESVAWALEPRFLLSGDYALANRLHRDMGERQGVVTDWVNIDEGDDRNDDIRALYTYLKVYSPGVLSQISESALASLTDGQEFVNPSGQGTAVGTSGLIDVLGIHDAWGVPLDYFLHVKLEYKLLPNGVRTWRVVDRAPVLRSRGISRKVYETWSAAELADASDTWIFSQSFPAPKADVTRETGLINTSAGSRAGGWGRAKGIDEDYDYVP